MATMKVGRNVIIWQDSIGFYYWIRRDEDMLEVDEASTSSQAKVIFQCRATAKTGSEAIEIAMRKAQKKCRELGIKVSGL